MFVNIMYFRILILFTPVRTIQDLVEGNGLVFLCFRILPEDGTPVLRHVGV
jgi:hypothetical protein